MPLFRALCPLNTTIGCAIVYTPRERGCVDMGKNEDREAVLNEIDNHKEDEDFISALRHYAETLKSQGTGAAPPTRQE